VTAAEARKNDVIAKQTQLRERRSAELSPLAQRAAKEKLEKATLDAKKRDLVAQLAKVDAGRYNITHVSSVNHYSYCSITHVASGNHYSHCSITPVASGNHYLHYSITPVASGNHYLHYSITPVASGNHYLPRICFQTLTQCSLLHFFPFVFRADIASAERQATLTAKTTAAVSARYAAANRYVVKL
jgi:hypothetical protein